MQAPFRSKPFTLNSEFEVNSDPEKLDRVYNQVLGRDGDQMLTEAVKWLAVTHKSFDHGRRGYNDRLAYIGKNSTIEYVIILTTSEPKGRRIVELQTSLSLLSGAAVNPIPPAQDQFGREPFQHPRLQGLNGLTEQIKHDAIEKRKLARLADRYGLEHVVRWKPKRVRLEQNRYREVALELTVMIQVGNLEGSGLPAIMAQALYAIVGAISLQRGGIVANDVVKDRILNPLGLR